MKAFHLLGLLANAGLYCTVKAEGAFFVLGSYTTVVSERVDPLLFPGQVSPHVHNIFGGDGFDANWDYDTKASKSTCNTVGPKRDHSNYWFPRWYFHNPSDGSYTAVPAHLQIYYHIDHDCSYREEFPPGFKMMSGNAMLRSQNDDPGTNSNRYICHGGEPSGDVSQYGYFPKGFTMCNKYPGFSGEIWFPFCWNGEDFDPNNPTAHVTFAEGATGLTAGGGRCPSTHSRRLPQLFMEFHHDLDMFQGKYSATDQPWVLASGDNTGWGMHADFVSGWEPGVLAGLMKIVNPATNQTACFVGDGDAKSCFPTNEFWSEDEKNDCKVDPVVDEQVDGPLSALPGCNTIQSGVATATLQTGCGNGPSTFKTGGGDMTAIPSAQGGNSVVAGASSIALMGTGSISAPVIMQTGGAAVAKGVMAASQPVVTGSSNANLNSNHVPNPNPDPNFSSDSSDGSCSAPSSSSLTPGWSLYTQSSPSGCYIDPVSPQRLLSGVNLANAEIMFPGQGGWSSTRCVAYCDKKGYSMAGTEYGGQCFCGNDFSSGVQAQAADTNGQEKKCDKCCEGDGKEVCGGAGMMTVFRKERGTGAMRRNTGKYRRRVGI
ncbi:MAG: hypothetical protein Q9160_002671 [Pyrenula sp. 1 TL-2023]